MLEVVVLARIRKVCCFTGSAVSGSHVGWFQDNNPRVFSYSVCSSFLANFSSSLHLYSSKHAVKMSDVESESTIRADEGVTAVTKPKRKTGKVNKQVANGGKRWTPAQVRFHI